MFPVRLACWLLLAVMLAAPAAARAETKRLLVVGAGPGGLAAAITAKKQAAAAGHDLEVVVFESRGESGTRKNMIALTRQSLDNLAFLGARLVNGETVQFLDRRSKVPERGEVRRGPRLAPVSPDGRRATGAVKQVLRQKNIATMPINGIEAELRREAAALGIVVKYQTAVEDVRDRAGGVELTTRDQRGRVRTEGGWMVVMAHGGDKLSAHRTDVVERPSREPKPGENPSLLERIGVVPRTDETIGSRMVARLFDHTGGREIRNRYQSVGRGARKTHHVRLDGPERGGQTALLSELPAEGELDVDAWSLEQARALGIDTAPAGPAEEFYLALTSARSAADPARKIAVVMGARGAAGAKLLVGESLRKSTPLTGKAAQVAISDGIDAGQTISRLLSAGGDPRAERALLSRYQRGRLRATEALQRRALEEFADSGIEPAAAPAPLSGPRQRSLRRVDQLRAKVKQRVRRVIRKVHPARRTSAR